MQLRYWKEQCLNDGTGNNKGTTAIPPTGPTVTADIIVAQVGQGGDCSGAGSGFVRADLLSGTSPNPPFPTGTDAVCVKTV